MTTDRFQNCQIIQANILSFVQILINTFLPVCICAQPCIYFYMQYGWMLGGWGNQGSCIILFIYFYKLHSCPIQGEVHMAYRNKPPNTNIKKNSKIHNHKFHSPEYCFRADFSGQQQLSFVVHTFQIGSLGFGRSVPKQQLVLYCGCFTVHSSKASSTQQF